MNAKSKVNTIAVEFRCSGCKTLLRIDPNASTWDAEQIKKQKGRIQCPGCNKKNAIPATVLAVLK